METDYHTMSNPVAAEDEIGRNRVGCPHLVIIASVSEL